MGETDEDVIDLARSLRALEVRSVPVNFLIPVPGTPFEHVRALDPRRCLRILALYRFLLPSQEIRIAGGREVHLRSMQVMGLYAANSIFIGDYLTTQGATARGRSRHAARRGLCCRDAGWGAVYGGPVRRVAGGVSARAAADGADRRSVNSRRSNSSPPHTRPA